MRVGNLSFGVFFVGFCILVQPVVIRAECDFEDFPVMENMKLVTVMENAVYNGRPMSVKTFETEESLDAVLEFYRRSWKDAYADSVFGPWDQITHINEECMMLVQAAEMVLDETHGRLSILNPPDVLGEQRQIGEGALLPPGSKVVSDNITRDDHKDGRTLLVGTSMQVDEAANFYRQELKSQGWTGEIDKNIEGNRVLTFRRNRSEYNIAIRQGTEGSVIVINTVDN